MPSKHKNLKAALDAKRKSDQQSVKAIVFPLPDLAGPGGNAFALLGTAHQLMKGKVPESIYAIFHQEATSGDYDHLLQTIQEWFTVATQGAWGLMEGDILDHRPQAKHQTFDEVDEEENDG